jgi:transcriptional antiterminator NusG
METKFYTVKVMTQREKSISERLKNEMGRSQLSADIFVPTERVYFAKNGKKAYKEKVLWPGYIFVETTNLPLLQVVLKSIPGNGGILKDKAGNPSLISKNEIDKIKSNVDKEEEELVDLLHYVAGEEVKIVGGPFDGFKGIIEELRDKNKVKLNVLIFGRSTPVDLSLNDIEKII